MLLECVGKMVATSYEVKDFDVHKITYATKDSICGIKVNGEHFSCNTEYWKFIAKA